MSRAALSPRQRQVLDLAWEGLTADEAGRRLGIAEQTVKNHIHEAYAALGVGCRMDAFREAGFLADNLVSASSMARPLLAFEAADALAVHVNTLKRIPPADLPYFRVGGRGDRRYRRGDVAAYIERRLAR